MNDTLWPRLEAQTLLPPAEPLEVIMARDTIPAPAMPEDEHHDTIPAPAMPEDEHHDTIRPLCSAASCPWLVQGAHFHSGFPELGAPPPVDEQ